MCNQWMNKEEFEKFYSEGHCWITYEDNVINAYYDEGCYWSHKYGHEYSNHDIIYVMPIDKPSYPRMK